MKLRVKWAGPWPRVNDYLRSERRPRYAYRIALVSRVDSLVRWDPTYKREWRRMALEVVRVELAAVPANATVHPWRWDKRTPARKLAA